MDTKQVTLLEYVFNEGREYRGLSGILFGPHPVPSTAILYHFYGRMQSDGNGLFFDPSEPITNICPRVTKVNVAIDALMENAAALGYIEDAPYESYSISELGGVIIGRNLREERSVAGTLRNLLRRDHPLQEFFLLTELVREISDRNLKDMVRLLEEVYTSNIESHLKRGALRLDAEDAQTYQRLRSAVIAHQRSYRDSGYVKNGSTLQSRPSRSVDLDRGLLTERPSP